MRRFFCISLLLSSGLFVGGCNEFPPNKGGVVHEDEYLQGESELERVPRGLTSPGTYRFEVASAVEFDDAGESSVSAVGLLVVGHDRIRLTSVTCEAVPRAALSEATCGDLHGTFGLRVVGSTPMVEIPAESSSLAQGVLKTIVGALAVNVDPETDDSSMQGFDTVGQFTAVRTARATAGGTAVHIRKTGYAKVADSGELDAAVANEASVTESKVDIEMNDEGSWEKLKLLDRVRIDSGSVAELPKATVATEVSLRRVEDETARTKPSEKAAGKFLPVYAAPTESAIRRDADRAWASRVERDHAVALLTKARPDEDEPRREWDLALLGLSSQLRLSQEVDAPGALLASACASGYDACKNMAVVLSSCASPSCQRAIWTEFERRQRSPATEIADAKLRRHLLRSVGTQLRGEPTVESKAAMLEAAMDERIGTQAVYGLGAYARKLAAKDPARSDEIVMDLERLLLSEEASSERAPDAVRAMGAVGTGKSEEAILKAAGHTRVEVARAAVRQLPRLSPDVARRLIGDVLHGGRKQLQAELLQMLSEKSVRELEGLIELLAQAEEDAPLLVARAREELARYGSDATLEHERQG